MAHYYQYYKNVINSEKNTGLKLVLGGTGLGKTSAIADIIKESLEKKDGKKYIYVANRVALLEEMKSKFEGLQNYIHIKSSTDTLIDLVKISDLNTTFDHPILNRYVSFINQTSSFKLNIHEIKRTCEWVRKNEGYLKNNQDEDDIRKRISSVVNFFKQIIRKAREKSIDKNITNYKNFDLSQNDYVRLIELPVIKQLFPYIDFKKNVKTNLLLVTLQKLYHGFFDGATTVNIESLHNDKGVNNGGNIIFLDEFDFLENDLISLISKSTDVQYPFEFVKSFYDRVTHNKLVIPDYVKDAVVYQSKFKQVTVREEIDDIISKIESISQKYQINYPRIYQFICDEATSKVTIDKNGKKIEVEGIKGRAIFQTSYTITYKNIFLQETNRNAFNLTAYKSDNTRSALTLMNIVTSVVAQILRLYKEIEINQPGIYEELLRAGFHATIYGERDYLKRIHLYPYRDRTLPTHYEKLHTDGLGLYEVHDLDQQTDKAEVELKYYAVHTTPERILLHLCRNNLVFGLSATADIDRLVRNFDTREFLPKHLGDSFLRFSKDDEQIIQKANSDKYKERQNQLSLSIATIDDDNAYCRLVNTIAKNNEVFNNVEHRILRAKHFFSTLIWILKNRKGLLDKDTHLLFFSSFKQIQHIFDSYPVDESDLYNVVKRGSEGANKVLDYYEITLKEQPFIIVFYNSAQGKEIENDEKIKSSYYKLFWEGKPVILITTYPSAGNGINLQYFPTQDDYTAFQENKKRDKSKQVPNDSEKDFKNIHLLDSPFFYYSDTDEGNSEQENNAVIKQNIYYLAKLKLAGDVFATTDRRFENYLGNIHRGKILNTAYLKSKDGRLNQIAVYIQALGRIERVWSKMANQHIRMDKQIYKVFQQFCTGEFRLEKEKINKHTSHNLTTLFQIIEEQTRKDKAEIEDFKQAGLKYIDLKCKSAIQNLLHKRTFWKDKNRVKERISE